MTTANNHDNENGFVPLALVRATSGPTSSTGLDPRAHFITVQNQHCTCTHTHIYRERKRGRDVPIYSVHITSIFRSPQRGKKMMSEPNPFVSLTISNQKQKTLIKPKTTDPRWEQNFQFLILDPREQELNVQVSRFNIWSKMTMSDIFLKVDHFRKWLKNHQNAKMLCIRM